MILGDGFILHECVLHPYLFPLLFNISVNVYDFVWLLVILVIP